ncbi:glycogen debranching N-terminal domain-containing protein [Mycolicibacterium sp.]|uniref:amylo-alpha-1,6-glucosidase n=1 Tax=Mycolicibacterium sp. TaxID=2320850 RepID=UPI0028ABBFDB|nr:glycogen debranching N-terminal domain-containing protein [Mycolicibacterium sp.]
MTAQPEIGGWASDAAPPHTAEAATVTLVEGSTFCVSADTGDIRRNKPHGLFVADTRILSCWQLAVDGKPAQGLSVLEDAAEPYRATFVGRVPPRPRLADSTLLLLRKRSVGDGMREEVVLRNLGPEAASITVTVTADVDFADLFAVKEQRVSASVNISREVADHALVFSSGGAPGGSQVSRITASGNPRIHHGGFTFEAIVPGRSQWSVQIVVEGGDGHGTRDVARGEQARRLLAWRAGTPRISSPDPGLTAAMQAGARDIGALRIEDPNQPGCPVVAAGAPWFMALFGRDSLLTAWMALALDPNLALCTLRSLARQQGTKIDPLTEEEPGRILHEVRLGREAALALGGGTAYYGTADATPLFVMLLGELDRWGGLPAAHRPALIAAADRALGWIDTYGDADGDGFVEYHRHTDRGLVNQGWKDSFDGVPHADGHLAAAPIALCEVQGYTYAAFRARAALARGDGDEAACAHWNARADALRERFNSVFWMPERRGFALALDSAKTQVGSLASNMGHCLWTGIADADKAAAVAEHLAGSTFSTGFGVRTLSSEMTAYNPMSYHNGSVWPHDTAIAVAGLCRYGFTREAQQIAGDLMDAAALFGGRLPELFCGFDRSDFPTPIPYPTSCSPQAWAAGASRLVLRSLLRMYPDVPQGVLSMEPDLPARFLPLTVDNIPLAGARLSISIDAGGELSVTGLPQDIRLVRGSGG